MDTKSSMPSVSKSNRNMKLDTVKTVLIFCVILGHTLQDREPGMLNSVNMIVKTSIFSFHMPLFILISGYFCNTEYSKEKLFKKSLEILAAFAVFQVIRLALDGEYSIEDILTPEYTLWYLLCLVYWRISVYFLSKYLSVGAMMLLSVMVSLGSGYIQIDYLGFQRACSFFPFFVLGYYCRTHDTLRKIDKTALSLPFLSLLVALVICLSAKLFLPIDLLDIFMGKFPYSNNIDMVIRGGWLLVSVVVSLSIYRLIADRKSLAKYGGCTLVIYLLHSFFTQNFEWFVNHHILYNDLLTNIAYSLVVFFLCVFLGRYKVVKILTKPVSFKY